MLVECVIGFLLERSADWHLFLFRAFCTPYIHLWGTGVHPVCWIKNGNGDYHFVMEMDFNYEVVSVFLNCC